jgi:carbon-monoxide dehydrogenase small subunit
MAAKNRSILTIEGLSNHGELHPLQETFISQGAVQCGYCTPGMIMTAKALLDENSKPSKQEVKEYLASNICRCTGYVKIVDAVLTAADAMGKGGKGNG